MTHWPSVFAVYDQSLCCICMFYHFLMALSSFSIIFRWRQLLTLDFFSPTFLPALETLFESTFCSPSSPITQALFIELWGAKSLTHSVTHINLPPSLALCAFSPLSPNVQSPSLSGPDEKTYDHLNKHRHSMVSLSVRLTFPLCGVCVCVCVLRCLCFFMYRHNCCRLLKHTRWACVFFSVFEVWGWSDDVEPSALGYLQPQRATASADMPSAVPLKGPQSHLSLLLVPG